MRGLQGLAGVGLALERHAGAPHLARVSTYYEFPVPGVLADVARCTWERAVPATVFEEAMHVVPDACVDIVWSERTGLFFARSDPEPVLYSAAGGTQMVGIRLQPGVASTLLDVRAEAIGEASFERQWGPTYGRLIDGLERARAQSERRALLEAAVAARRPVATMQDGIVFAALRLLGKPGSRISALPEQLPISARQLQRRCHAIVGYGPKVLDRVLRFQRFLAHVPQLAHGQDHLAGIAAQLGYADQAHLTRECSELGGFAPTAFLQAYRSYAASAAPPSVSGAAQLR